MYKDISPSSSSSDQLNHPLSLLPLQQRLILSLLKPPLPPAPPARSHPLSEYPVCEYNSM